MMVYDSVLICTTILFSFFWYFSYKYLITVYQHSCEFLSP